MSKSALIVAISDYPAATQLPGAAQDLTDWTTLLQTLGFTMRAPLFNASATSGAIMSELTSLLQSARQGDELAMIYSGHGTSALGFDGLVGYFASGTANASNTVLTTDLNDIIKRNLPAGTKLTTILDCCHAQAILPPPAAIALVDDIAERSGTAGDQIRFLPYDPSADTLDTHFRRFAQKVRSLGREVRKMFGPLDEPLRLAATDKLGAAYEGKMPNGNVNGYFSYSLTTSATSNHLISHNDAILKAGNFVRPYHADQRPHIEGPRRPNPFLT